MIPRRIEKKSILAPGKVFALLVLELVVLAFWAVPGLPLWLRALGSLLIAASGLYVIFGRLYGKPVAGIILDGIRYLFRPKRRVWARQPTIPYRVRRTGSS